MSDDLDVVLTYLEKLRPRMTGEVSDQASEVRQSIHQTVDELLKLLGGDTTRSAVDMAQVEEDRRNDLTEAVARVSDDIWDQLRDIESRELSTLEKLEEKLRQGISLEMENVYALPEGWQMAESRLQELDEHRDRQLSKIQKSSLAAYKRALLPTDTGAGLTDKLHQHLFATKEQFLNAVFTSRRFKLDLYAQALLKGLETKRAGEIKRKAQLRIEGLHLRLGKKDQLLAEKDEQLAEKDKQLAEAWTEVARLAAVSGPRRSPLIGTPSSAAMARLSLRCAPVTPTPKGRSNLRASMRLCAPDENDEEYRDHLWTTPVRQPILKSRDMNNALGERLHERKICDAYGFRVPLGPGRQDGCGGTPGAATRNKAMSPVKNRKSKRTHVFEDI